MEELCEREMNELYQKRPILFELRLPLLSDRSGRYSNATFEVISVDGKQTAMNNPYGGVSKHNSTFPSRSFSPPMVPYRDYPNGSTKSSPHANNVNKSWGYIRTSNVTIDGENNGSYVSAESSSFVPKRITLSLESTHNSNDHTNNDSAA